MNIRKRKDGYYQTNVYLETDPITKKKKQKTFVAKTKSECRKKALDFLASNHITGSIKESSKMTFSDFLDDYLMNYTSHMKPGSLVTYTNRINKHLRPFFGEQVCLYEITPKMCQDFVNQIDLKPKTVHAIHATLHSVLEKALSLGLIQSNPSDRTTLPKMNKPGIHPLSEDELPVFLSSLDNDVYSDAIYIDAFTGLRISELIGLTWDRIDLEARTIMIDRTVYGSNQTTVFLTPKNGKSRIVPLPEKAYERLLKIKKRQEKEASTCPVWNNPHGFIFTHETGTRIYNKSLEHHFKKRARSAGFDSLRFHDLRHTYAVISIKAGVDFKSLSEALGHASVAFTMDTYAFVSDGMRREQLEKLNQFSEFF